LTRQDEDKTVIRPAAAAVSHPNGLPAGHRLHEFRVDGVLGVGGFSIVYLARDMQLERTIALKEYMPTSLAMRGADLSVAPRSGPQRETFDLGLRSFVNEARLLASFDHPALVKVHRFWEENGTAYMVMPYYDGPTLKQYLLQLASPPDEAWLKRLSAPLLDALALIHSEHCYHRDIAPDNILLLGAQHKPLLLDFGAARRVISGASQALTVILKPGYAPVEQYADVPAMKQGAWTDVYALCAVLYAAITGKAPVPSVGRTIKDELQPVSALARGRYSAGFLAAIDDGLAVRPEDRPQTIAALRERLLGKRAAADTSEQDSESTRLMPEPVARASSRSRSTHPIAHRIAPWLATGVGALLVGGLATWLITRDPAPAPRAPAEPAATAATPPPPSDTPGLASPGGAPAAPLGGSMAMLEDMVRRGDPRLSVNVRVDQQTLVIHRDRMQFRVMSSEAGHLYVFHLGAGADRVSLLFPNALDKSNRIGADKPVVLPRATWQITASGPPGTDTIVAMVSREPREFGQAGLRPGDPIGEFDPAILDRAGRGALAGMPRCGDARSCDSSFGAALAQIQQVEAR